MTHSAAARKQAAKPRRRFGLDHVRFALAGFAALLGAVYGYWKAGLLGALITGAGAGALVVASFTLFHVGVSVVVVLLAFVLLFLLYSLFYYATNP